MRICFFLFYHQCFPYCREKAQVLEEFIRDTVKQSLVIIENGQTPRYFDGLDLRCCNSELGRREKRVYEWKESARQDIAILINIINNVCPFIKWNTILELRTTWYTVSMSAWIWNYKITCWETPVSHFRLWEEKTTISSRFLLT